MPKIKIRGYQELIEVSQEIAQKAKKFKLDSFVENNESLDLGTVIVEKKDIVSVFLDPQPQISNGDFYETLKKYYQKRDELIRLTPLQRAQKSAWGHFLLFYYGIYQTKPPEDMKLKVVEKAVEFYSQNQFRATPSLRCWFELLNLSEDTKTGEITKRILEKVEGEDYSAAKTNESYQKSSIISPILGRNYFDE